MPLAALPLTPMLARRLAGTPLALFLDIDGTLAPIAPRPELALIPSETKAAVRELAALPNAHVLVVTGRTADDARRMVDVPDAWVIGNHGIEVAPPRSSATVRDEIAAYEDAIQEALQRAAEATRNVPGALVENKRWSFSVHFRLARPEAESELEPAIATIGRELGLRMMYGKKIFELRPPLKIDKGTATIELARRLGALHNGASVLYAGDDLTDEDAFRALRASSGRVVTVRVGEASTESSFQTAAEFGVPNPTAMREFLEQLLALRLDAQDAR